MDRLESLGNTLSQITMYDIKSMYNQAKNVVLNVSEVEAKVREATNDDPWGASSTLMQDIANRTFNYPDFNEIMPSIYSRFMEKEARQWRQIYKALQLLEYLIKNGSERVVDDARSHISTIKMLRNFYYVDEKGKDEGLNIRNRAKEIVELLSDVEKIRSERRKAKANKNKYTGQGNDGMSFSSGGGGGYGGFGNDSSSYVGGSGRYGGNDYSSSYAGRSSFSGGSNSFRDDNRRFEEYDAGDDEVVSKAPNRVNSLSSKSSQRATSVSTSPPAPAPAPQKEVNLIDDFDDDAFSVPSTNTKAPLATNKELPAVGQPSVSLDDDDFDSFQSAPAPVPTASSNPNQNLFNMLNSQTARPPAMGAAPLQQPISTGGSHTQAPTPQQQPFNINVGMIGGMNQSGGMVHRPTMSGSGQFGSFSAPQPQTSFGGVPVLQPMGSFSPAPKPAQPTTTTQTPSASKPASSANFDDLWSMSLGSKPAAATNTGANKSIKDLEKEKAAAGLWGATQTQPKPPQMMGGFGSFSNSTATSTANSAGDDLLL